MRILRDQRRVECRHPQSRFLAACAKVAPADKSPCPEIMVSPISHSVSQVTNCLTLNVIRVLLVDEDGGFSGAVCLAIKVRCLKDSRRVWPYEECCVAIRKKSWNVEYLGRL